MFFPKVEKFWVSAKVSSNVSNKEKFPAEYTEALEAQIMETEAEMVRRFGYL